MLLLLLYTITLFRVQVLYAPSPLKLVFGTFRKLGYLILGYITVPYFRKPPFCECCKVRDLTVGFRVQGLGIKVRGSMRVGVFA